MIRLNERGLVGLVAKEEEVRNEAREGLSNLLSHHVE
jgi:hypothetical protein